MAAAVSGGNDNASGRLSVSTNAMAAGTTAKAMRYRSTTPKPACSIPIAST
ncbi:hypothetical protein M8494_22335 [Serratia ureilytica]